MESVPNRLTLIQEQEARAEEKKAQEREALTAVLERYGGACRSDNTQAKIIQNNAPRWGSPEEEGDEEENEMVPTKPDINTVSTVCDVLAFVQNYDTSRSRQEEYFKQKIRDFVEDEPADDEKDEEVEEEEEQEYSSDDKEEESIAKEEALPQQLGWFAKLFSFSWSQSIRSIPTKIIRCIFGNCHYGEFPLDSSIKSVFCDE